MLEQYYRINQVAGITITVQLDGSSEVNACYISADNKRLNIEQKITGLQAIKQLNKYIAPKTGVALNITGKGILYKQIEKTEHIDQANFGKVFPNANINDFYVQNFISGSSSFVAVIRRVEADRWLNQVREAGYLPLSLSLGPFPADNILPQLNFYGDEIKFAGHEIQFDDNKYWKAYQYNADTVSSFPVKVDNETIDEKLVVAYAAAFQLILAAKIDLIAANVEPLTIALNKKLDQLKFKTQGFIVLAGFFLLLLINMLVLSLLNNSNNKLTQRVSLVTQSSSDVAQLAEQIKQKESLLQTLGWDGGINKSALIDQAASLLPSEVKWSSVEVNPLDQVSSRIRKMPVFFNRRIKVNGTSEKIIPVNEWIARIHTLKWVKSVQLETYSYNNELNTGLFTVLIDY